VTSARRYTRRKPHLFDLRNEVAGQRPALPMEYRLVAGSGGHDRFARPSAEEASGRRVGAGLARTMSGMDAAT